MIQGAARFLLPLAAIALSGCGLPPEFGGPVEYMSQSVDVGSSESARVVVKMDVGELRVDGGSPKLIAADFSYNSPSWKPIVRSTSSGSRTAVSIEQPDDSSRLSNTKYQWDLRLNDGIPLDLKANFGVGHARMSLGSLNLRSLEIHMGVGELNLDLRGEPKHSYDVSIAGGVGHASVRLPKDAGIYAKARGGVGGISARGLEKEDGRWINPAHARSAATIHLDIRGGVGHIELIAE
jgi:uncharacterized protein DUF2154